MAQIRETKCLSKNQIGNIMNNWATIFGASKRTILYEGKPVFSAENIKKWNLPHLTKFAENYTLHKYEFSDNQPSIFILVIETDKFDKINIQASVWFYHFFQDEVYKTQTKRPEIYISPAFVVTPSMYNHVPINILPCMYRFVPLPEVYAMIGSKNTIYSMTWDYRILTDAELEGTREYSQLFDSDPIVKILNAVPGDTIQYKRVLCEGSPYGEYYRRKIINTMTDVHLIAPSGICIGAYKYNELMKGNVANADDNDAGKIDANADDK